MHLVQSGFIQLEGLFGQRVARAIESIGLMHMSVRRAKPMSALLIIQAHLLEATAVIASQAMPPVART